MFIYWWSTQFECGQRFHTVPNQGYIHSVPQRMVVISLCSDLFGGRFRLFSRCVLVQGRLLKCNSATINAAATPRFHSRAHCSPVQSPYRCASGREWSRIHTADQPLCSPISPFVGCTSVSSDAILVSQAMARRELLLDRSGLSIGKHDFVHLQSPPTPYDLPIFGQFHRRHTPIYKKWQVVIGATSFFTRSDT